MEVDPAEVPDGDKADGETALPDVHCDGIPTTTAARGFRHVTSRVTARLDPRHRGIDLIATASAPTQRIAGVASYGLIDKALEDENVELFACRASRWVRLGRARTADDGSFALELRGSNRLPLGMRDLFVSIEGDRTGARFVAFVGRAGDPLAITDVDGTITRHEESFGATIVLGLDIGIQDGAPAAFQELHDRGYPTVYLTARSRAWTETTRTWLAEKGMPRGLLQLAPHTLLPDDSTVDFKAGMMEALTGFDLAVGIGNRANDVEAYARAGIAPDRIFVKLPEFRAELAPVLAAGQAIGFEAYDDLRATITQLPVH